MSDLAATNCGCGDDRSGCGCNNGCGCNGGCGCGNGLSLFGNGSSCSCVLWIIILLCACGNTGFGCNNGCGCGNSDSCWIIVILLLLCSGCGCGNGCGC